MDRYFLMKTYSTTDFNPKICCKTVYFKNNFKDICKENNSLNGRLDYKCFIIHLIRSKYIVQKSDFSGNQLVQI